MKGICIERATPGNVLDIYDLFKKMHKENPASYPKATDQQVRGYYFPLLNELSSPHEIFLLAKKGRTYWGFFHGSLAIRPFGTERVVFIKSLYVAEKKRGLGIGKQLYESARGLCQKMGVSQAEFMCDDLGVAKWEKKVKAKRVLNYMIAEI